MLSPVVIALLAALLAPAVRNALSNAQQVNLIANGTQIHKSVFSELMDEFSSQRFQSGPSLLPQSTAGAVFDNSNAYFASLVTNGTLDVGWSFFSGPGLPAAAGKGKAGNPATLGTFTEAHNAWIVVADLDWSDSNTPFLITRNLSDRYERLLETFGDSDRVDIIEGAKLGDDLVTVYVNGAGEKIPAKHRLWIHLNPDNSDNPLLRPGTP